MCGISGAIDRNLSEESWVQILRRMGKALEHRGPDAGAIWFDAAAGVGFSHRRLSIIDLSPQGAQPMLSSSGRFSIVFNGEIYNFLTLRNDLTSIGHCFRGHSDTEVVLAAFELWGIEPTLRRLVGMFAFALWDRDQNRLYLGRDRFGEKPLYYGWQKGAFLFGSELKALRSHPSWEGRVNRNALALFLRYNYIPAPHTIYEGIFKLSPGTLMTIEPGNPKPLEVCTYWSAVEAAENGFQRPFTGSTSDAINELESLLKASVAGQMLADVPLGAFLSGGIDSSLVVALMQSQAPAPVKTFTIGFEDKNFDEAPQAAAISRHLGTDHTELYVSSNEIVSAIPKLPSMYDEPFADASQLPTFLVAKMARQHVTVSLSGDAGDELFGGYNRHVWGPVLWRRLSYLPQGLRLTMSRAMLSVPPKRWDETFGLLSACLPSRLRVRTPGDKVQKLASILGVATPSDMYRKLVSHWDTPASIVRDALEPSSQSLEGFAGINHMDLAHQMMLADTVTYLPDDILVKVDRATMGVSLESRAPYLDHRVVEFAWRLPMALKIRDGESKWALRQVLYRYVPKELIERPKSGFGLPIGDWLRSPLRDWAESLLDESRLTNEGYFDPAPIRKKWQEHLKGDHNWQYHLWSVLMFQAWLEESRSLSMHVLEDDL